MVCEMDSHQLTSLLDALRQFIISPAGVDAAAGMVVYCADNRGIREYRFLHDDTDVNGCFRNTALTDTDGLDEFIVLIAEQTQNSSVLRSCIFGSIYL